MCCVHGISTLDSSVGMYTYANQLLFSVVVCCLSVSKGKSGDSLQ